MFLEIPYTIVLLNLQQYLSVELLARVNAASVCVFVPSKCDPVRKTTQKDSFGGSVFQRRFIDDTYM